MPGIDAVSVVGQIVHPQQPVEEEYHLRWVPDFVRLAGACFDLSVRCNEQPGVGRSHAWAAACVDPIPGEDVVQRQGNVLLQGASQYILSLIRPPAVSAAFTSESDIAEEE